MPIGGTMMLSAAEVSGKFIPTSVYATYQASDAGTHVRRACLDLLGFTRDQFSDALDDDIGVARAHKKAVVNEDTSLVSTALPTAQRG